MDVWNQKALKALILPGGVLLVAAGVVFRGSFGPVPTAAIDFYYYAVFAAGILLAWRFHSSRILFALLTLFLASRALELFSAGQIASAGPGRVALEAVALLLPLNLIAFAVLPERGWAFSSTVSRLGLLFFESVFVAVICRPGSITGPVFLHPGFLGQFPGTRLPTLAMLAFIAAIVVVLSRFLVYRKPTDSGLLWALPATLLSFQAGAVGPTARAYIATAGLILASSIIENSYLLAYHDELTTLPGRRAFNDALFRLEEPYAVAVVDVDHFKNFNDTYGHETGDQVLRMVASRLAGVTGGGEAYRVGGEEFTILFPGKSAKDIFPHLELLRQVIAASNFQVRGGKERRSAAHSSRRGPSQEHDQESRSQGVRSQDGQEKDRRSAERRTQPRRPSAPRKKNRAVENFSEAGSHEITVTVSIGAAEPNTNFRTVEQVIQAADKALYRAKQSGRNRVELSSPLRAAKSKRNIA